MSMRRCWAMMLVALAASVQAAPTADSPAIEYLQKKQQVKETDAAGLKSLGEWAEAHGLSSQAAECYRKSLELGLDDEAVYESLMKIADNTKLPPEPGAEASLKQEFTGRSVHVTSHFLIVYGPDSNWAMNRAVLLERTYDSFYQVMRAASLRPLPLTKRLVCLLFDKYEDYAAYADRTDGLKQQWVAGYYSSRTNRIAFFNDKTNPAFDEVKLRTAALEQQLGKVQAAMNEAVKRKNTAMVGEYRRHVEGIQREIAWYRNRQNALAGVADASKTTHEAVHQLAFNSGVQKPGVMYPFWLSEGLACNFETADASKPFGPYMDNAGRRQRLLEAHGAGRLMGLESFVSLTRLPSDPGAVADLYSEGFGLFQFLFRKRHEQMRRYLVKLATGPVGVRKSEELRRDFEDVFGPLEQVQTHWATYLKQLPKK